MDRLKKYDFLDENGHRLEDCADYQAIFSEHDAELARVKAAGIEAMRRAEQAEAENVELREDLETSDKSLKEYEGFFADLCAGLKNRFPKQYENISDSEYGEDAFSSDDIFEHVIDPAIQEAEDNVARLTRLVKRMLPIAKLGNLYLESDQIESGEKTIEAASRAVGDGE